MEERIHSIKIFKEDKVIADGSVKIDDFFNTTIKDLVKNVRSGDAEKEERIPPFLFCLFLFCYFAQPPAAVIRSSGLPSFSTAGHVVRARCGVRPCTC